MLWSAIQLCSQYVSPLHVCTQSKAPWQDAKPDIRVMPVHYMNKGAADAITSNKTAILYRSRKILFRKIFRVSCIQALLLNIAESLQSYTAGGWINLPRSWISVYPAPCTRIIYSWNQQDKIESLMQQNVPQKPACKNNIHSQPGSLALASCMSCCFMTCDINIGFEHNSGI